MKKQFVIYDFNSNMFIVSLNQEGIVWGKPPMLFDSQEEANQSLEDAYGLFPEDFIDKLIVITDVLISEKTIQAINKL